MLTSLRGTGMASTLVGSSESHAHREKHAQATGQEESSQQNLLRALSLLLKNRPLSSPGFLHPHLSAIPGTESASRHDLVSVQGQSLGGALGPTQALWRRRVRKNVGPQLLPKCHQPLAGYEDYLGTIPGVVRAADIVFLCAQSGEEAMAPVVMNRVRG